METITPHQQQVLTFIESYMIDKSMPPTQHEIASHFGYKSKNASYEIVRRLAAKGYLNLKPRVARGIELVHKDLNSRDHEFVDWYKRLSNTERRDIRRLCLRRKVLSESDLSIGETR